MWGYQGFGPGIVGGTWLLFLLVAVWSLAWKGWGLWVAAHRGEKPWFIAMLILNTAGLLEIFYLFVIAKQRISSIMPGSTKADAPAAPVMPNTETTPTSEKEEEKE